MCGGVWLGFEMGNRDADGDDDGMECMALLKVKPKL